MAISLSKGQKVDLTKNNAGLKVIMGGLSWDANSYDTGDAFDLDQQAWLLAADGKCAEERDFIYYNNMKHHTGAVIHSGDERTGATDGYDEMITIEFDKVPTNVEKIRFTVTIHDAEQRKQNFGQVQNASFTILNKDTNDVLCKFDLGEDFSIETAVVLGEVYRNGSEWKFNAIGSGFSGGLKALCAQYGIDA